MDILKSNQNITNTHAKPEVIGIHANAILQRNIANSHDINKRMDALCIDPEICKGILGEEVYEISKSKLTTSKPFLDIQDHDTIKKLPEFQEFLKKYQLGKERQETINSQTEELAEKKNLLKEMDLPTDIQSKKDEIDKVKKTINDFIDEKEERKIGNYITFMEYSRKNKLDDPQKQEKLITIYDFVFNYIETISTKKKRKPEETSIAFFKRIGIDYSISHIKRELKLRENKINDQIKKWKEKKGQKISINKKIDLPKNDYTDEALQVFIGDISKNKDIRSRFYLPEDKKEIEHIQSYFKAHLQKTIKSPDMENLIQIHDMLENTIEKEGEKIKIHTNDYLKIQRRKLDYQKMFISGKRNPREYLFDRLIEYVGQDILEYEAQHSIEQKEKYHGTTFEIYKTDGIDDTSAGADYIIIYQFKNGSKKIAAIDLFVSDKEEKTEDIPDNITKNSNKLPLEEKLLAAKELKIPYSSYIQLFQSTKVESYKMKPIRRYVEKQDPTMVYMVLNNIIKDKKVNVESILDEFKNKGRIYNIIQTKIGNDPVVGIQNHLNNDIIKELELNVA